MSMSHVIVSCDQGLENETQVHTKTIMSTDVFIISKSTLPQFEFVEPFNTCATMQSIMLIILALASRGRGREVQ